MGSLTPHKNRKQLGLEFHFPDQDSSSTQSYPEGGGDSCLYKFSIHSEGSVGPNGGGQDYGFASQPDHTQPYTYNISLPYYGGLLASYSHMPQPMIPHNFQRTNVSCTRVPLPVDFAQGDEPVYVNAKQYYAILRRRQYRAKLEAQNKLSKPRKPYLHESRHSHALKRARGPSGRFLNLKEIQETQPDRPLSNEQDDPMCHGGGGGGGMCSGNNFLHRQELKKLSNYVGGPAQAIRPSAGGRMLDGTP